MTLSISHAISLSLTIGKKEPLFFISHTIFVSLVCERVEIIKTTYWPRIEMVRFPGRCNYFFCHSRALSFAPTRWWRSALALRDTVSAWNCRLSSLAPNLSNRLSYCNQRVRYFTVTPFQACGAWPQPVAWCWHWIDSSKCWICPSSFRFALLAFRILWKTFRARAQTSTSGCALRTAFSWFSSPGRLVASHRITLLVPSAT